MGGLGVAQVTNFILKQKMLGLAMQKSKAHFALRNFFICVERERVISWLCYIAIYG